MEEFVLSSFESKLRRLTPQVKTVLVALETGNAIEAVCKKHNVDKRVFSYAGLVGMVLMGDLNPNLLVKNIVEKEGIDVEKAKLIALDLSAAIFQPIKQELITMYGLTPKPPSPTTNQTTQNTNQKLAEQKIQNSSPPQPPSTRPAGDSLQGIPNAAPPPPPRNPSPPSPSWTPTVNDTPKTAMPAPLSTPLGRTFYSPTPSGPQKSSVIDLSKEPPKPVAKPGEPPLEGNIVNLKNLNQNNP